VQCGKAGLSLISTSRIQYFFTIAAIRRKSRAEGIPLASLAAIPAIEAASPFKSVELAPKDPILGMTELFLADTRKNKINLGVGVPTDENGKVPVLAAVQEAERVRLAGMPTRSYLPIDGMGMYNAATQKLLFGADSPLLAAGRAVTVQALGGTGGLKIGADFLKMVSPNAMVLISDPSWENHLALFTQAGFEVSAYPYYDAGTFGLDFDGMLRALNAAKPGTIVVLHGCCHNPTGVDPTREQWLRIVEAVQSRGLMPFVDLAYQGFGDGIDEDGWLVHELAHRGMEFLVSSSFSKSFSLYGERVGALSIVTADAQESARVLSQLKRVIRTNYSNPPTHGSAMVALVLTDPKLRALWEQELGGMRARIRAMRTGLVEKLRQRLPSANFDHIAKQRGMFSYSGITAAQAKRLRDEFAIYALDTGRICVAALNEQNLDAVADAIATVSR
jgi:aromatic-amino-acid transaminase